jgi:hypothetical protein
VDGDGVNGAPAALLKEGVEPAGAVALGRVAVGNRGGDKQGLARVLKSHVS